MYVKSSLWSSCIGCAGIRSVCIGRAGIQSAGIGRAGIQSADILCVNVQCASILTVMWRRLRRLLPQIGYKNRAPSAHKKHTETETRNAKKKR